MHDIIPGAPGRLAPGGAHRVAGPDHPFATQDSPDCTLSIGVTHSDYGPVVVLSGEADQSTLAQLISALNTQVATGARLLTLDLSQLRFADSATVAAFVRTAHALRGHGAELELLHPQPRVARILSLTGVDQTLTVRRAAAS
jgi:anti-sigma B factor antagonist